MGGIFVVASKESCVTDLFFATDYHSHLGTRRGGMAVYDKVKGFDRAIHNIQNSPFRTKFELDVETMSGTIGIGCISDFEPQPLLMQSKLGSFALTFIGKINNYDELIQECYKNGRTHFNEMTTGQVNVVELLGALISEKDNFADGIRYAQEKVEGSLSLLLMTKDGIYAARDMVGRTPVIIGHKEGAYCVAFESFAYLNLGYQHYRELGPGEIDFITADKVEVIREKDEEMKICSFLWTYYGYPNSCYEGKNVEVMRCNNGKIMARDEQNNGGVPNVDYVAGVPDSGVPHAIGYAHQSGHEFARPFVKYTPTWPRSFMPTNQKVRNQVAKMKQIPVPELIDGKKLLLVDDSIVRGTQLRETVDFLYKSGAKEVHMRSACPPIMHGCKFLNFSRSNSEKELLARKVIQDLEGDEGDNYLEEYADSRTERGQCMLKRICEELGFDSLGYQSIEGVLESIGIDKDKVCTYCWTGKE